MKNRRIRMNQMVTKKEQEDSWIFWKQAYFDNERGVMNSIKDYLGIVYASQPFSYIDLKVGMKKENFIRMLNKDDPIAADYQRLSNEHKEEITNYIGDSIGITFNFDTIGGSDMILFDPDRNESIVCTKTELLNHDIG